jgi:hypothetical protein
LYLSPLGAIIGSPNASSYGVGRNPGESGRLLEIGVFFSPESLIYAKAAEWFEELFSKASTVDQGRLTSAPENSRELVPLGSRGSVSKLPFLCRLRDFPQNFPNVRIAIAVGDLDNKKAEASRIDLATALNVTTRELDYIVVAQNNKGDNLPRFGGNLILIWLNGLKMEISTYVDCLTWPRNNPDTIFGVEDRNGFWEKINLTPCADKLTNKETMQLRHFFNKNDNRWVFTSDEFALILSELKL